MKEKLINFFSDVKDVALIIFGIIGSIFAALFFYEKKQNEVQKAENLDAQTKTKVEAIDNQIKTIQDETKEKENEPVTKDDLLKFLDDSGKPK
jgi:peptidoglycan hydrolase CwlO-like protein